MLKEIRFRLAIKEEILESKGGEALAQAAQRSCLNPGSAQGQVRQGSEQSGLEEGIPAHGRGLEQDDL